MSLEQVQAVVQAVLFYDPAHQLLLEISVEFISSEWNLR